MGSQGKGPPGVIEAVRVRKAHVATRHAILSVSALHPEDVLWILCHTTVWRRSRHAV